MHRSIAAAAVILVTVLAGACSSEDPPADEFGPCTVAPGVICKDQDLRNVNLLAADLRGVDLSGSDLSGADMRNADLTGAKLVGATLGSTNLEGAILKDADLSDALLFFTNFTDADLTGAIMIGAQRCNVVEPDGGITLGELIGDDGQPVPCAGTSTTTVLGAQATGPPTVEYFRLTKPERCLNDAGGTGIEVEWYAPNAHTLTFFVDGVRIETATKARGVKRMPFVCNGKPHIVSLQAFGVTRPAATSAFSASLRADRPLTSDG